MAAGILYIVATPIGNLEDITLRALRVLKEVDLICVEDTRRTRKLLSHYQIKTPLISYHAHNQESRGPELLAKLQAGQNLALVSDAGTPGFSDPGTRLVAQAWEAGIKVEAVPGPAAGVAALSMSGFPGDVTFLGFPPRKAGKRREFFANLAREPRVLIFYESPRRLVATLEEMARYLPSRQVLVVRELTKVFEEAWRGPLKEVAAQLAGRELKGECTIVLSCPGPEPKEGEGNLTEKLLTAARESGLSGRRLVEKVVSETRLPHRRVYQAYLELKEQKRLP
jgi:16S rRNA (cytidine1402-2'-O)-methyltransferase|uniref:Ribosomal RNA small subunit methyltransferase I n=1 Tax=Desulfobacca acetoxidans TaxID=60893 RepID=A0A7C5EN30_9BACT